jgi:hypothetical protein
VEIIAAWLALTKRWRTVPFAHNPLQSLPNWLQIVRRKAANVVIHK